MFKKFSLLLVAVLILMLCSSCGNSIFEPENKLPVITQEYVDALGGKVFDAGGSILTFYGNGEASYDYFEYHYDYLVEVTGVDEEKIEMLFHYNMKDSLNYNTTDIIDYEPKPATYKFADNTVFYYKNYTCISDDEDTSEDVTNYCASSGCEYYVIPSSETDYCFMHTSFCEHCGNYVNPGVKFCSDCKACVKCGEGVYISFGDLCHNCVPKTSTRKTAEKCYLCNGTGKVKYYYGASDYEAWLDGHEPSWYGLCGVCGGTGVDD